MYRSLDPAACILKIGNTDLDVVGGVRRQDPHPGATTTCRWRYGKRPSMVEGRFESILGLLFQRPHLLQEHNVHVCILQPLMETEVLFRPVLDRCTNSIHVNRRDRQRRVGKRSSGRGKRIAVPRVLSSLGFIGALWGGMSDMVADALDTPSSGQAASEQ